MTTGEIKNQVDHLDRRHRRYFAGIRGGDVDTQMGRSKWYMSSTPTSARLEISPSRSRKSMMTPAAASSADCHSGQGFPRVTDVNDMAAVS